MLYEVITKSALGAWQAEIGLDAAEQGTGIAALWARGRIEWLLDRLRRGADEAEIRRITSYNVCYTKLLRIALLLTAIVLLVLLFFFRNVISPSSTTESNILEDEDQSWSYHAIWLGLMISS